jgi:hypothetical protein
MLAKTGFAYGWSVICPLPLLLAVVAMFFR